MAAYTVARCHPSRRASQWRKCAAEGAHLRMTGRVFDKKKARLSGPSNVRLVETRSGGLGVDLGEVVLSGLGAVSDELAEIFARGLRPRHEHFAARADHVGLDLDRFVERLGGSQLVDAGEERFGVLVER